MTATALNPTTTYEETKRLIHRIVYLFLKRYGGETDEAASTAHEAFMRAINQFDPERGAFTTKLWHEVWYALLHAQTKRIEESRRFPRADDYDLTIHEERTQPNHTFAEWLSELSSDAKTIALLTIHSPEEIRSALGKRRDGKSPHIVRSLLRHFLTDMGWCAERITSSFEEVRRALR